MRLFHLARDMFVRLLVCAADKEDITIGGGTPPIPSPDTGSSPQSKRRRKELGGSAFPLENADLEFHDPMPGSTMAQLLERTMDIYSPLFDNGSIFNPIGIDHESFTFTEYLMSNFPYAGIYFRDGKIGRSANCETRYEEPGEGIVICAYDKLPGSELDVIEESLSNCFKIIKEDHFDGDVGKWLREATIGDAQAKEKDMGGISIFFCIFLHQTLDNGGLEKLGVRKGLFLNHLESALQLNLSCNSDSVVHEHLHCPSYLAWLADNKNAINDDLKEFQAKILDLTGSKTLSKLEFVHKRDLCTWMPGYECNSPEVLLDKLEKLFEGKKFPMSAEGIRSVVESQEDEFGFVDALCDEKLDDELGTLEDIKALVSLLFHKIGDFISVTEIAYDLLFRVFCSKNKHWHDMYEAQTKSGKTMYDPESLGEAEEKKGKENMLNEIKAFKKMVDKCGDKSTVHWMRVDRMLSAFKKDKKLKDIITNQLGMREIHHYLETTVYAHESKTGCMGLIFLHHAFSKSLASLPPWEERNFSPEQFQDQGRAGIAFDWNKAVGLTFDRVEGHEDEMVSPNTLIGSLLVAFVLRMYIIRRLHHGDYRIATCLLRILPQLAKTIIKGWNRLG